MKHLTTIRRSVVIILWKSCEKHPERSSLEADVAQKGIQKTHQNALKDNAQNDTRKNTENVFIFQNDLTQVWNKCHKKCQQ